MRKPIIVYPDADDETVQIFSSDLSARLNKLGRFKIFEGIPASDEDFLSRVGEAEAVILGWAMPSEVMLALKNLKLIVFTGIGVANFVDLNVAKNQGISVCNTPGYANQTVAEHTIALILSSARKINKLDSSMKGGHWKTDCSGYDLNGKTLGLIGLGGIGGRVSELAKAFGMKVICWTSNPDPSRAKKFGLEFATLEQVFESSDIVSLHLALTDETRGMINAHILSCLRKGCLLINTARAELIDEEALMIELISQRIFGAFDVFHEEPLSKNHPMRRLSNVILTPHNGYNTPDANYAICDLATSVVESYYAGELINEVKN